MASHSSFFLVTMLVLFSYATKLAFSDSLLSRSFYQTVCPQALPIIRRIVFDAVRQEPRMGASLLRLHFHDCIVNGCDASVLLDSTPTIDSEKNALGNANSLRGFEVIDQIKLEVDRACNNGPSTVSCADILAVAARDSVVALGGPSWPVQLGRRDSTTASRTTADNDIPTPFMDLPALVASFSRHGLGVRDLVALSGAHTLGFAQCRIFRSRVYNDTNIDNAFASRLRAGCPPVGGDSNLASLDQGPFVFGTNYFSNLLGNRGLLHSDQALFGGAAGQTGGLVQTYSRNYGIFARDFAQSMIKMGNINPLTGNNGEVRVNCRKVN
ncbi:hypothetical protein DM860_016533 [Cuscuta australis]|uniref:Peroxidase n=1 Tax=Cuscuta australis TaxID=267555 RepID=A0A328E290_9ASTE|nr:hypothetical protein DM860_016533 [Cuscuta australis]